MVTEAPEAAKTQERKRPHAGEAAILSERGKLVDQVVRSFVCRVPPNVPRGDLLSAARWGLVDAVRRNQGCGGPAFESYARLRIRGAVIDELRSHDYLPRRARWLVSGRRVAKPGDSMAPRAVVSLEDLSAPDANSLLTDNFATDPSVAAEASDTRAELKRAVARLPEREREIVSLHYFGGMKFKDIGRRLGVSEPRISQLHSRAVARLRADLTPFLAAA